MVLSIKQKKSIKTQNYQGRGISPDEPSFFGIDFSTNLSDELSKSEPGRHSNGGYYHCHRCTPECQRESCSGQKHWSPY